MTEEENASHIRITGSDLSVAQIVSIAYRRATTALTDEASQRVTASAEYGAQIAQQRPVYGRTTGVGANRTTLLSDPAHQAISLLRSHATAAGNPRSRQRVRAALAVRLNQLATGGSGVSLAVVEAMGAMLTADTLPAVNEGSSIGTGDLSVFATLSLAVAGVVEADPPIENPVEICPGDALAVMSSNAATLADTALSLAELRELTESAIAIAALTHFVVGGNMEAFSAAAASATPFPGAKRVFAALRNYLADGSAPVPARIQDPFALRSIPQVHGPLLDRLDELDFVFTRLANAPTENPLLLPGHDIAHHGGFHAAYLAQALDATRSALAQSAQLGLSRLSMLTEPSLTGLAPFLAAGAAGASGIMMLEYVAASALAYLRGAALPLAIQSVTLSRGVEEDASFAAQAVASLRSCVVEYRTVLACELVAAVRGLRMQERDAPESLAGVLAKCDGMPDGTMDRDLSEDLAIANQLLPSLGIHLGL